MGHVVVPRRSDGTLNRGLVCVAHQTWTIKIPTSLRKRICDCRLIQKCKQEKEKKMMSAPLGLQVGTGIHTSNSPQGAIKLIQYDDQALQGTRDFSKNQTRTVPRITSNIIIRD